MTKEALKLALDFVETVHVGEWVGSIERQEEVIAAIKKALAQPEEERIGFAGVKIWVGDQRVVRLLTRTELDHAIDPWLHVKLNADMCIATLLKRMSK